MGHVGKCPVQEYRLKCARKIEKHGRVKTNKSFDFGQNWNICCKTHCDQVSGAEEPVDLGWLCKFDQVSLPSDYALITLKSNRISHVQTEGENINAPIFRET